MKKYLALALVVVSVNANAAGWTPLKKVCWSKLNQPNYNDFTEVMRKCNETLNALNIMQTDNIVFQGQCTEAREGSGSNDCWGAKLTAKILVVQ